MKSHSNRAPERVDSFAYVRSSNPRVRAIAGASASVLALFLASGAYAQSAAPAAPDAAASTPSAVGEVVVTGSRIVRKDFTSNSPIVTVNAQQFQNTANVAIEDTLNKLPQFVPDQNMTGEANSGDVQPTGTHTVGISTISLRGFGPNRNLVLADGQRLQPSNGELVVDINTIPAALIDHVEIITGGASAVYGADAVAGVVNFILKKNYQGMDVDASYGVTQAGDGQQYDFSALMGTNFADDKGNITFALEHFTRSPSYQANRSFYTKGWSDPSVANNEFFGVGSAYLPNAADGFPSQSVVNSIFSKAPAGAVPNGSPPLGAVPFYFNNNGTVYTGQSGFGSSGASAGTYAYTGPINGTSVAYANVLDAYQGYTEQQSLKTNQTNYYLTAPISRWSMYGSAHYDITPDLTAYIKGSFDSTHTSTILFPTPFITGWGVDIPYNPVTDSPVIPGTTTTNPTYIGPGAAGAQHPVSTQLAELLNSRPNPNAPWQMEMIPDPSGWMPPRSTVDDNTVWQLTAGLQGKLPVSDFTWELYGSHGQASDYTVGEGYASLARYQALMQAPDYGAGASITGNQAAPNYGFGAATGTCTSGFYSAIFSGGSPSKDCINSITAQLQSRTLMEQNVVEFDTQGGLFNLPAGQVRLSLGADYRDDSDQYTPDILQSTASFLDQVAGVYPTAYMNATTSAREGYGELVVPVLRDLPFVKRFELDLGARYSTYTATDHINDVSITPKGGWTYKIEGDWTINDWARLRGGYNLAVRSPNVGELFLGRQEVYAAGAATAYGDPCSLNATAPWGANAALNANAASTQLICRAQMGATGATTYYGSVQAPGAPSPFGFVEQEGNSNLRPEKAHTWTLGLVLNSPWHGPLTSRLHASLDWYSIKLDDAIEFNSVDNITAACYDQTATDAASAATIAASPQCQLLSRNPGTGAQDITTIQYSNLATVKTQGLDLDIDWGARLDDIVAGTPGSVQLSILANYLLDFQTQSQPGAAWQDWAGTFGPTLTGLDAGAFRFRTNTTLTYMVGPASIGLTWRYLPHMHGVSFVGPGPCTGTDTALDGCTVDTPAHHEFDLAATWTIEKNYVLRFGINNLFDSDPPITGATTANGAFALASDGQGTTNEGLYDALGRAFYVGIDAKF